MDGNTLSVIFIDFINIDFKKCRFSVNNVWSTVFVFCFLNLNLSDRQNQPGYLIS